MRVTGNADKTASPKFALTPDTARLAVPMLRIYRLPDGGGLYLEVHPNGGKFWRFRYRYDGKQNSVSCGVFPAVQIEEARTLRNAFSAMLANGINPSAHVKAERAMQAIPVAQARFTLDSDGALSFRLASRRLALTPAETLELRTFLDATRAVIPKETSCP